MNNSLTLRACALTFLVAASACGERPGEQAAGGGDVAGSGVAATAASAPSSGDTKLAPTPAAETAAPRPTRPAALVITSDQILVERSAELAKCLESGDAAKGVTVAMAGCFNAELKLQDQRLNAAYGRAMARLNAAGQARLRQEERAWIRQRDDGCAEAATGGTIDQVEIPACHLDETVRRRLVLESSRG